jgi:hypothetical protein
MEKSRQTNRKMELPSRRQTPVGTVLASAADLADTVACAHGERPEAVGLPEFMNSFPGSLYNNVAFGTPRYPSELEQVVLEQSFRAACAGLNGDCTKNVFFERQKSENRPFLAASGPLQYAENGKSKKPFPTGRKFGEKIFTFFLPAGNFDTILLDIRLDS